MHQFIEIEIRLMYKISIIVKFINLNRDANILENFYIYQRCYIYFFIFYKNCRTTITVIILDIETIDQ